MIIIERRDLNPSSVFISLYKSTHLGLDLYMKNYFHSKKSANLLKRARNRQNVYIILLESD